MILHHLVYRSEMALPGHDADQARQVQPIIEVSRARNLAQGVTGALAVTGGIFVQVLEGSLETLETTFERICRDLRHRRLQLLEFAPSDERTFAEWPMAHIVPTGALGRLCADIEDVKGSKINASKAAALVKLMHEVLRPH